jgi:single-strand DNA-binding protein
MNQVIITGNLGRDPEMRYTPTGKAVTQFSVAVAGYNKDSPPTWFNVTCWDKQAEIAAEYLRKGSKVLVTGSIMTDSYIDREQVKRYKWWVNARQIEFLDRKPQDDNEPKQETLPMSSSDDFDSLPF